MNTKNFVIGGCWLGLVLNSSAYTSPHSSMAVAGSAFTNQWATTPNMDLVADNTWQGTQQITNSNGQFKFAANGNWTTNWGDNSNIVRVPAIAPELMRDGANTGISGLSSGLYRFTFNDATLEVRMEWAGASPLPLPSITNMAVVGDFNGWAPSASHLLTNSPANTNLWSGSIMLDDSTAFQFQPNGNPDDSWGAPKLSTLYVPATNVSACGKSSFTLSGFYPGTFSFTLDTSNATFTVSQTTTQEISVMTVQGNFIATNNPSANMMRISDTSWESDHFITNTGTITVRFSALNHFVRWGVTNGTPAFSLPASGTLLELQTNYVQISGVTTGRYRIMFNHQSGDFGFELLYAESSGPNLLINPGFEQATMPDGGDAVNWGSWQSWPKRFVDGYTPHSGSWCGAIHGKMYPEWTDYGYFFQDVPVIPGTNYRVSAWLMASADGYAATGKILMLWYDDAHVEVGPPATLDLPDLSTQWVKYSLAGQAPPNATTSHVVFACLGSTNFTTLRIDDVEMRAVRQTNPKIHITNIVADATSWQFHATGNDTLDPVTNFLVFSTTNLLVPTNRWATSLHAVSAVDGNGGNVFTIPFAASNGPAGFYRIDPRIP